MVDPQIEQMSNEAGTMEGTMAELEKTAAELEKSATARIQEARPAVAQARLDSLSRVVVYQGRMRSPWRPMARR